ncbi:hypothetical protein B0H17DRAFT_1127315 [Mycena rosella]|uniref:Uncharacterized protein n=1 Tax=Mycena rosella TaxID=1033263 RepID=A0AAD7M6H0_MYCRO|nr:hypothetical protein B0H17DRAFT_1127315 [Mycena rosella]
MQTELPGYFVRIPARFPRPNGGAYVAPAPEPPRACPLKQPELPEFFQRGLPPFLQYLKQDHANHVRKNELMCDRRFLGRETRQPVPRQATVALRLPHTLASTPEEHQDNARVVVGYAAKCADGTYFSGPLASMVHAYTPSLAPSDVRLAAASIFERSPEEIAAAREERVAIFRALLGPAARAYLDAPDVLVNYHVDFINETVTVWTPDNDAYMAAVAADDIAAQDNARTMRRTMRRTTHRMAPPSSTTSSTNCLPRAQSPPASPAPFRARRRIVGAVGGGGGHGIAAWLASIPAAADAVPVVGTGEAGETGRCFGRVRAAMRTRVTRTVG